MDHMDKHDGPAQRRMAERRGLAERLAAQRDPDPVDELDGDFDDESMDSLMIDLDDDGRFF